VTRRNKAADTTRIIACAVFKPAIEHLHLARRYPNLRLTYLPSNLHLTPQKLENCLLGEINFAEKRNERMICLYGECFPGLKDICAQHGAITVPGHYCHEMLLGTEQFQQLMYETAGTYFVDRDLILNFGEYCIEPLELHDEEMRKCCFEHYQRLLYVRQPADTDLMPSARELAEFLELSLEIRDADYSYLERKLIDVIQPGLL